MVNPKKVASDPNRPWLSCQKWGDPPKMRKNHLDHRFVQSKSAVEFWSDPILDIHQQTLLYECNLIKNRDSCQLLGSNRHELIQPLFLFNAIFKTYCGFGLLLVEGLFSIVSSQFMSSYEARFKKTARSCFFPHFYRCLQWVESGWGSARVESSTAENMCHVAPNAVQYIYVM